MLTYLFRFVAINFAWSLIYIPSLCNNLQAQSNELLLDTYFNVGEKEDLSQSFYIGPYIELTEIGLKKANIGGMVQLKRHSL